MVCYVPALIICIIPIGFVQWLLMIYSFGNSTFFLVLSLKKHIEGLAAKAVVVFGVLAALQLVFFLVVKLLFINLGVPSDD